MKSIAANNPLTSHKTFMLKKFLFAYAVLCFLAGRAAAAPTAPALTTIVAVDPTGSRIDSKSYATFRLHVFFSDRSGSLYCWGDKVPNKLAVMTCEMTPEGAVHLNPDR